DVDPVSVAVDLMLERRFRIYVFERRGTFWDSGLAPVHSGRASRERLLILHLEGNFVWEGPRGRRFADEPAVLVSDALFEGERGRQPWTFATWGEPFRALYLHADSGAFSAPPSDEPIRIEATPEIRAAASTYVSSALAPEARLSATHG